jgi:N-methylhydantoinase A
VDMRYYRQGYEFPIGIELNWLDKQSGLEKMVQRFREIHYQNYGFNIDHEVEIVNLRAIAVGVVPKVELRGHRSAGRSPASALIEKRKIYVHGKWVAAPLYDRDKLATGNRIEGPAVITQKDSTTLILPGHFGSVDPFLNILIWPKGHRPKAERRGKRGGRRK